ncbi:MAG: aminodeoxychorismate synthase, component I [Armatimonadetes bacterium JP3_11]|nr:MAG: aminodeoxychorismate synthase, component I [Armatimonadetes bacterium CP1_7O]OYT75950.1 MAG: aminodeoxychorismate synthase, component I [Armatimonadetes bacterium JP3_11]RMH07910.1 MAG: aminodeoxychorismate synthase component I [Armatimonadota bacterium]
MSFPGVLVRRYGGDGRAYWLHGGRPETVIAAYTHAELLPALAEVERAAQAGLSAVGFMAYEAAQGFDQAFPKAQTGLPLLWFGLYQQLDIYPEPLSLVQNKGQTVERLDWQPTLTQSDYDYAVRRIRDFIGAGDVYQVNYSFRLRTTLPTDDGMLLSLFCHLYRAQPVPYAAYIDAGEYVILSLSPELFFALEGKRIVSRPMKGTAPRGVTLEEDLQQAQALRCSEKNRAENLMIVDMVRNDLGRIAAMGTVRVPRLFEVERYATLWQMTSTVEAQTDASLPEIFRALFPAASITGAPKIRAMQIIHELETTPRGIYTGAVGVVLPNRQAQFNVAIRTLCYDRATQQFEYGVGSGIVWDSENQAEYAECLTKAHLLLRTHPEFELLETLLWRVGRGYFLLEKHLQRLQRSADYFGFPFDELKVRRLLMEASGRYASTESLRRARCRLLLNRRGEVRVQMSPLEPKPPVWRVALAPEPIDPSEVFLYHKTTHRTVYEKARAAYPHCEDVILWNPRGEITESTLANVVVRLDGRLYTPPVGCGLLNGVYRQHLLERGTIQERILTMEELLRAEAIYLINSVRGWVRVNLCGA